MNMIYRIDLIRGQTFLTTGLAKTPGILGPPAVPSTQGQTTHTTTLTNPTVLDYTVTKHMIHTRIPETPKCCVTLKINRHNFHQGVVHVETLLYDGFDM